VSVTAQDPYFEDYAAGDRFECGSITVTEDEIVAFAALYDPQTKHVDREAASRSPFASVIASGWQTAALSMQLLIARGILCGEHALGVGIDELRWLAPVRGADTLSLTVEIAQRSLARPDARRGTLRAFMEMRNQHGTVVFTQTAILSLRRRQAAG
jgi:acyl dehydratase